MTDNPLVDANEAESLPQGCTVVIFGGAGDLARRKLVPALFNLALDGILPANVAIVGFARTELSDDAYRQETIYPHLKQFSRQPVSDEHWQAFAKRLHFVQGTFEDKTSFERLGERLKQIDAEAGIPGNRIFYLSVPPSEIATCAAQLSAAHLIGPSTEGGPFTRIVVEKPLGRDLESARELQASLAAVIDEKQIFRIDHYLGKETVQNILVTRFANSIFEPLWNQKYVDHVQITVAEEEGVGTRAGYYDTAGALRDMVQNHLLQLLCLVAMEPPWSLAADVVRDHKLAVLKCLRPLAGEDVSRQAVRAQYSAGYEHGQAVPGYLAESRVAPKSTTETYVAIKSFIDNWRWSGVPFYLRTGKRLAKRSSEISVQFKEVPQVLFNRQGARVDPNVLALRIQPDEGMSLKIVSKTPGARVRVYPVNMDFRYDNTFGAQTPEAYERLLLDVMIGDASLFMREDAVEAAWSWIDPIIDAWSSQGAAPLPQYAAGTWGPAEADKLFAQNDRGWRKL